MFEDYRVANTRWAGRNTKAAGGMAEDSEAISSYPLRHLLLSIKHPSMVLLIKVQVAPPGGLVNDELEEQGRAYCYICH